MWNIFTGQFKFDDEVYEECGSTTRLGRTYENLRVFINNLITDLHHLTGSPIGKKPRLITNGYKPAGYHPLVVIRSLNALNGFGFHNFEMDVIWGIDTGIESSTKISYRQKVTSYMDLYPPHSDLTASPAQQEVLDKVLPLVKLTNNLS